MYINGDNKRPLFLAYHGAVSLQNVNNCSHCLLLCGGSSHVSCTGVNVIDATTGVWHTSIQSLLYIGNGDRKCSTSRQHERSAPTTEINSG